MKMKSNVKLKSEFKLKEDVKTNMKLKVKVKVQGKVKVLLLCFNPREVEAGEAAFAQLCFTSKPRSLFSV